MILTKPEKKLLSSLKEVQGNPDSYVIICDKALVRCSGWYQSDVEHAMSSNAKIRFIMDSYLQEHALKQLVSYGYVEKFGTSPVVRVSHQGWFCSYITRIELWRRILNSVICPIIVSVFTTLLINVISHL